MLERDLQDRGILPEGSYSAPQISWTEVLGGDCDLCLSPGEPYLQDSDRWRSVFGNKPRCRALPACSTRPIAPSKPRVVTNRTGPRTIAPSGMVSSILL